MIVVFWILVSLFLLSLISLVYDVGLWSDSLSDTSRHNRSDNVEIFRITITSESCSQQTPHMIQTKSSKDLVYNDKTGMFE